MTNQERDPAHGVPDDSSKRRGRVPWPVIAVPVAVIVLVWPLQAILVGLLVAVLMMASGAYVLWSCRQPMAPARRRVVDRVVRDALLAVVAVGIVASLLWPVTMALATLCLAVASAVAWLAMSWLERERDVLAEPDVAPAPMEAPVAAPMEEARASDPAPSVPEPTPRPEPTPARQAPPRRAPQRPGPRRTPVGSGGRARPTTQRTQRGRTRVPGR